MQIGEAIERYCNAKTRSGGRCRRVAGWGTPIQRGPCKNHGGALPNVRKHHARAEALSFVAGQMGAEVDVDLLEAPLIALRIARGIVVAWQERIASCDGKVDATMDEGLRIANMDFARIAKLAVDAGVSERQIKLVERLGDELSLLFEEALSRVQVAPEVRKALTAAYAEGLARLEGGTVDSTAEDVAA